MSETNEHTRTQHDAVVALGDLGRLIERLPLATLVKAVHALPSDNLESLRMALATLSETVERETLAREDAGAAAIEGQ